MLAGERTLALLPTGQGKSLCYQIPGLALNGLTIVISPLIALMKDQVDALQRRGITATYINSALKNEEVERRYQAIQQGEIKFLYVAPERLLTKKFLEIMIAKPPSFIAIDEAHCFSTWGHDFRPLYRNIPIFIQRLNTNPKLALFTATASAAVVEDLQTSFKVKDKNVFRGNFFRPNLFITLKKFELQSQRFLYTFYLITRVFPRQPGLIYVSTRKMAEMLNLGLKKLDFNNQLQLDYYHAGRTNKEKTQLQEKFLNGEVRVMIATNAFGMGIDKPDIRFVIHFQTPGNLENYVQEIGRAGRDRQFSWCELLFHPQDFELHQQMQQKSNSPSSKQSLQKIIKFVNQASCHHEKILSYFQDPQILTNGCARCQYCSPYSQPFLKTMQEQLTKPSKLPTFIRQQQLILGQNVPMNPTKLLAFGKGMLQ